MVNRRPRERAVRQCPRGEQPPQRRELLRGAPAEHAGATRDNGSRGGRRRPRVPAELALPKLLMGQRRPSQSSTASTTVQAA
jgi:hypothetical protein